MEPGEQSGEVRARMAIIFTSPCSRPITHTQGHHRHGQKQRELPGTGGEWLVIYWPSPSLSTPSVARAQEQATKLPQRRLLDPLEDIETYSSGMGLESLAERQFQHRETPVPVRVPQR